MSITRFTFVLLFFSAALSGCATIVRGTNQDIPVSSNPSGAEIIVDGMLYGRTPTTIQLHRGRPHQLTLELEGYQPYYVSFRSDMGKAIAGNCCVGGIPGMAVDSFSGAANSLSPDAIHAELIRLDGTRSSPPERTFQQRFVGIQRTSNSGRAGVFMGVMLVIGFLGFIVIESIVD